MTDHSYARQRNPVHLNFKFKKLKFFDIRVDPLKLSLLVSWINRRLIQESQFYFYLTPQQATDIASSRNISPDSTCKYIHQLQLQVCLLETNCEQKDFFAPKVTVKVNNELCPLPNIIFTNKPGVVPIRSICQVNITSIVKLSPTVANVICVSCAAGYERKLAITVALVHRRSCDDLLQQLISHSVKHSDHTRGLIKKTLNEDADGKMATTGLRVSLMSPLGKMRMSIPCRSSTCSHLQCFDASWFLLVNERRPTWNCPVCDKPALYDNLFIDGYFQDVLAAASTEFSDIQLHKDGSWSAQLAEKAVARDEKVPDDSIIIILDDVDEELQAEKPKKKGRNKKAANNEQVATNTGLKIKRGGKKGAGDKQSNAEKPAVEETAPAEPKTKKKRKKAVEEKLPVEDSENAPAEVKKKRKEDELIVVTESSAEDSPVAEPKKASSDDEAAKPKPKA